MRLFAFGAWTFHLEFDWNIWFVRASFSEPGDLRDVGLYLGPLNLQIEKYDRGISPELKPEDAVDDPERLMKEAVASGDDRDWKAACNISDLVAVSPEKTGLPWNIYIATNVRKYSYDPRVYVPWCSVWVPGSNCRVLSRSDVMPVAISPRVRLVRGWIKRTSDFSMLSQWVNLNRPTLLSYWNEQINTQEALDDLTSLTDAARSG